MALVKIDLVNSLVADFSLKKKEAKDFVNLFFDGIKSVLSQHEAVHFPNFGNFEVRQKKQRLARNPRKGESVLVKQRYVIKFKPGQQLKPRIIHNTAKEQEETVRS